MFTINMFDLNEMDSETVVKSDPVLGSMVSTFQDDMNSIEDVYRKAENSAISAKTRNLGTDEHIESDRWNFNTNYEIPAVQFESKARNSFLCKTKLSGHVLAKESGHQIVAGLEDENGERFIYQFDLDAIPPAQRARVEIGVAIKLLIGDQYEGRTLVKKTKLCLDPFSSKAKSRIADKVIERYKGSWDF